MADRQFDTSSPAWPGPALPRWCYKALHSYWVDNVFSSPHVVYERILDLVRGCHWLQFMEAIEDGRLTVHVTLEARSQGTVVPYLWVKAHLPQQPPIAMAAVDHADIGADPDLLMREQQMRMEDALAAIWESGC